MRRFLTIDDFARLPDAEQRDATVSLVMTEQPEFSTDDTSRLVTYTFSTPAVARDMHTVSNDAWALDNFNQNPVFLWAHDDMQPPIGRVVNIGTVNQKLKGSVEYIERDISPFADMIYRMVKARYLNAVSTSWLPLQWMRSTDKSRPNGIDFTKVDLLEISQVPIPALPTALAEARSAGIDTTPMVKWAEELLDRAGLLAVSRGELEQLRRTAMATTTTTSIPALSKVMQRHTRVLKRATQTPHFKRGLYDVSQLCYLLYSLGYALECSEYEEELEGDTESQLPAMLGEALQSLGAAVKAMAVEEVDELLAMHDADDDVEVVEARGLTNEQEQYIISGKTPQVRAWRTGVVVARAGKALSSSNSEKLEDASGHHERAMKHSKALGEHHDAVAGHLKEARTAHGTVTKTLSELGEHVRAAQEADPKDKDTHLKKAAKASDKAGEQMGAVADAHDDAADRHADVGDSHQGMTRAVKSAQRCVRSVVDGAAKDDENDDDNSDNTPGKGNKGGADNTDDGDGEKERAARERRARVARSLQLRAPVNVDE